MKRERTVGKREREGGKQSIGSIEANRPKPEVTWGPSGGCTGDRGSGGPKGGRRKKTKAERRRIQPLWQLAAKHRERMRSAKQRGEWAELCFMARAAELGLCVCKPYGDSSQFDVGIEHDGRLIRVQTKSTTYARDGSFTCNLVGPGHKVYPAGVLDFFAVYLVPLDVWYMLPFEAVEGTESVQFAPMRAGHKYQRYLEAWHLLRQWEG